MICLFYHGDICGFGGLFSISVISWSYELSCNESDNQIKYNNL